MGKSLPRDAQPNVVGRVAGDRDIEGGDDVVRRSREPGVEAVLTQRLEREQDESDRHQRHRQQRRPAFARPIVGEQIEEEEDRECVIDAVENDVRPRPGSFGHNDNTGL